jgi:acetoin utilization protein AcuB
MFVKTYMTTHPVFVSPDDNFHTALHILRKQGVRHLPVVEKGRLVGVVVEKDLLSNQPSQATSLSLYEIYSLLETLRVQQIMSHPVLTVESDCPLEEAARIMVENTISCLPVMQGDQLVGIITETDVFKALVEILGGEETGLRLILRLPERVGQLALLANRLAEVGANIVAVTGTGLLGDGFREVMIKTSGAKLEDIQKLVEGTEIIIEEIRPTARVEPRLFG